MKIKAKRVYTILLNLLALNLFSNRFYEKIVLAVEPAVAIQSVIKDRIMDIFIPAATQQQVLYGYWSKDLLLMNCF
ncbi:MAG TPA: hypothetical protein VMW72_01430 [Sedimentisphaerales bacterium]|nr:hypothetical protein [Sedimentisphaerales bacterium]